MGISSISCFLIAFTSSQPNSPPFDSHSSSQVTNGFPLGNLRPENFNSLYDIGHWKTFNPTCAFINKKEKKNRLQYLVSARFMIQRRQRLSVVVQVFRAVDSICFMFGDKRVPEACSHLPQAASYPDKGLRLVVYQFFIHPKVRCELSSLASTRRSSIRHHVSLY